MKGAEEPSNFGPDQFVLTTLGGGSTRNTLYMADSSNTDTSGLDGTLNGTPTVIATAPSGDVFKGLAWAPVAPGTGTPETSWALALPIIGVVLLGGAYVVRRRRGTAGAPLA